jgi:hypothetical protein
MIGLACLAPAPTPPAVLPNRRYLGIPTQTFDFVAATQKQEMWCWAASIEMLLRYYGVHQTQEQIVTRVYGQPFNEPGTDEAISASLNGWGVTQEGRRYVVESRVISGTPAPHAIFRELSNGRPMLLTFSPGLSVGHAVVLTGASAMHRQIVSLVYRDPAPSPENFRKHGRVELSFEELAAFLPSIRSYWIVSVRQA